MTEKMIFEENITLIAAIAAECRKLDPQEYAGFKQEVLETTHDRAKSFVKRALGVIDILQMEGN